MSRRQRRTQQSQSHRQDTVKTVNDIPHVRPSESLSDREKPARTLLEIAAEKQAQLQPQSSKFKFDPASNKNVVNVKINEQGKVVPESASASSKAKPGAAAEDEDAAIAELPPWIDTLFLATSLSALHFTLEVLTVHQYAQTLKYWPIFMHTVLRAFPTLALLIHFFHGHLLRLPGRGVWSPNTEDTLRKYLLLFRQTLYLAIANIAGCYLIYLTNDKGYYAVMKNAPSVGTVWIWSVIEMGLVGAVAGVIGPGLYAWYYRYGIF